MSDFNIPKATLCTFACAGLVCARGRSFVASLFLVSVPLMFGTLPSIAQETTDGGTPSVSQYSVGAQGSPTSVPRVIRLRGTLTDSVGKPITGPTSMTMSLYSEETGGSPLFVENQSVQLDEGGHYDVLLGSTSSDGLPPDLLQSNEPRWLSVEVPELQEKRRTLLVAVPYALKAADADTLGGLPASAFVLAPPASQGSMENANTPASIATTRSTGMVSSAVGGSGTPNYIPVWTGSESLGNSMIYQGSGKIGIGTTTPGATLDVLGYAAISSGLNLDSAGSSIGFNRNTSTGAIYNSGYHAFQLQQNLGDDSYQIQQYAPNGSGMGAPFYVGPTGNVGLAIASGGGVGIGTTGPNAILDVEQSGAASSNGTFRFFQGALANGSDNSIAWGKAGAPGQAGLQWFMYNSAGPSIFGWNHWGDIASLTVQQGGNVGVGTMTPTARLDVVGGVKIEGAGNGITFPDGTVQTTANVRYSMCVSNSASSVGCSCSHVDSSMPISNGASCTAKVPNGCSAVSSAGCPSCFPVVPGTFGVCCACH